MDQEPRLYMPGLENPSCVSRTYCDFSLLNPLNAKLNPICHLLALLEAHLIFHVSSIRVNLFEGSVVLCRSALKTRHDTKCHPSLQPHDHPSLKTSFRSAAGFPTGIRSDCFWVQSRNAQITTAQH